MEYRRLGQTDLKVSLICLGTMTWGEQNTEVEAHEQMDAAFDLGVNFIDTAEIYPVPPRAGTYGMTEQYIGTWLKKRRNRDKVILATKVAARGDWLPYVRGGQACLDRKNIEEAVHASLKRMQTDYIDLYQLHWPDRKTNFFGRLGYEHDPDDDPVALEETLKVLGDLAQAGKIRHVGLSNETPWGVMTCLRLAGELKLPRAVSVQNPYSLLNRTYEIGLAEISHREHVGLLAYSPMGFGALSGKYILGARPEGARLSLFDRFQRYSNPRGYLAVEAYVTLARRYGLDPAQMALAYVNSRSFITSTIIGATNMEQLKSNIESISITLTPALLAEIEAIHRNNPNPCP